MTTIKDRKDSISLMYPLHKRTASQITIANIFRNNSPFSLTAALKMLKPHVHQIFVKHYITVIFLQYDIFFNLIFQVTLPLLHPGCYAIKHFMKCYQ